MEPGTRNKARPTRGRLVIRTYDPRDLRRVWELHQEGLRDTGALYPDADPKWDDDLRNVEAIYLGGGSHFWVAEENGQLIGMTAVVREDRETARLRRMRVTPGHRRRGLGQRLLDTAEDFCRGQGYRRMVLDTTDRQQAALRLYEKNGFFRTGERPLGEMRVFFYAKELGVPPPA